jgi:hypothetical protein
MALDKVQMDAKFTGIYDGPQKGPYWRNWSFNFQLMATCANIWKFYNGYYRYPAAEAEASSIQDFLHYSEVAFAVLNRNVGANIQEAIRQYADSAEPGYNAWQYLESTYRQKDVTAKISLQDDLQLLRIKEGERVDDYLSRARALRDEMRQVGLAIEEEAFCLHLVRGVDNIPEWESLCLHFQYATTLTEADVTRAFMVHQRKKDAKLKKDDLLSAEKQRLIEGAFLHSTSGPRDDGRKPAMVHQKVCWCCKKWGTHNWFDCRLRKEG